MRYFYRNSNDINGFMCLLLKSYTAKLQYLSDYLGSLTHVSRKGDAYGSEINSRNG